MGNNLESNNKPEPKQGPEIRLAEIRQHKSRNSMWVIIQGNVYDVTSFIKKHPGGAGLIEDYAGKYHVMYCLILFAY
jgi:cytochrome b involved in lipid metabolism